MIPKPGDAPEGVFDQTVWVVLSTGHPMQKHPRESRVNAPTADEARKAVLREFPMCRVFSVRKEIDDEFEDW